MIPTFTNNRTDMFNSNSPWMSCSTYRIRPVHYMFQIINWFKCCLFFNFIFSFFFNLPVTLIGMIQEEIAWESPDDLWSDGGTFSFDQFVCLSWVEGALGAEAWALLLPKTSPPSPSPVEVACKKQADIGSIKCALGFNLRKLQINSNYLHWWGESFFFFTIFLTISYTLMDTSLGTLCSNDEWHKYLFGQSHASNSRYLGL